jgi:hypothetical protein
MVFPFFLATELCTSSTSPAAFCVQPQNVCPATGARSHRPYPGARQLPLRYVEPGRQTFPEQSHESPQSIESLLQMSIVSAPLIGLHERADCNLPNAPGRLRDMDLLPRPITFQATQRFTHRCAAAAQQFSEFYFQEPVFEFQVTRQNHVCQPLIVCSARDSHSDLNCQRGPRAQWMVILYSNCKSQMGCFHGHSAVRRGDWMIFTPKTDYRGPAGY